MAGIGKYKGVGNFEMDTPTKYAPFKMKASGYGNSPMQKNFGVGGSPAKFSGMPAGLSGFQQSQEDTQNALQSSIAEKNDLAANPAEENMGSGSSIMSKLRKMFGGGSSEEGAGAVENPLAGTEKPGLDGLTKQQPTPDNNRQRIDGLASEIRKSKGGGTTTTTNTGSLGSTGGFFSDVRLKEKIKRAGASPSGIPIYEFNYIGDNSRYSGVMAQDLLEMNIDAVSMDASGYYKVNYNNIDVDMHLIN